MLMMLISLIGNIDQMSMGKLCLLLNSSNPILDGEDVDNFGKGGCKVEVLLHLLTISIMSFSSTGFRNVDFGFLLI